MLHKHKSSTTAPSNTFFCRFLVHNSAGDGIAAGAVGLIQFGCVILQAHKTYVDSILYGYANNFCRDAIFHFLDSELDSLSFACAGMILWFVSEKEKVEAVCVCVCVRPRTSNE